MNQAGYDPDDGAHLLGIESLSILLKFVYKSQLLAGVRFFFFFCVFELLFFDLSRLLRTTSLWNFTIQSTCLDGVSGQYLWRCIKMQILSSG